MARGGVSGTVRACQPLCGTVAKALTSDSAAHKARRCAEFTSWLLHQMPETPPRATPRPRSSVLRMGFPTLAAVSEGIGMRTWRFRAVRRAAWSFDRRCREGTAAGSCRTRGKHARLCAGDAPQGSTATQTRYLTGTR